MRYSNDLMMRTVNVADVFESELVKVVEMSDMTVLAARSTVHRSNEEAHTWFFSRFHIFTFQRRSGQWPKISIAKEPGSGSKTRIKHGYLQRSLM